MNATSCRCRQRLSTDGGTSSILPQNAAGLATIPTARDFAKLIWKVNAPTWDFDEATFDRTAASFDNRDDVSIVIHNYRWRLSLAEGDPQYDHLEKRLAEGPVIAVPTITLDGEADGVVPATDGQSTAAKFVGGRQHRVIPNVGHTLPQEDPTAFAAAVWELASKQR